MVGRLFVERDDDFNLHRLKLVGARAVPFLITALADSRIETTKFGRGDTAILAGSPLERICDLLEPFGPAEAAGPLAGFISHKNNEFRKQAAISLGNIGTVECVAPVLTGLDDHDDYVRSYALTGIQQGIEAGRCQKEFLDAVFPAVVRLLDRDDSSVSGDAPQVLLAIDRDRALPVLLSEELLTVRNDQLHYILRALNASEIKIPRAMLHQLLEQLGPLSDEYPHDCEYAEAFIAYAHIPDESADKTFREALQSRNKRVQKAAAMSLAIVAGLSDPTTLVLNAKREHGVDGLTEPQKLYYATYSYLAEVNNGGHAQYFVNPSGHDWRCALRALTTVGANKRAKLLQEAADLFGPAGPPEDNDERHRQLARFPKSKVDALSSLDDRFYQSSKNLEALLLLYAIDNKQSFSH